ncbi:hypothetical protein [Streptomyces sp. NBC_00091]|uniref:hypothetical protein n=1 Tax=Streptomyces sp. NBC_00091 TaxID=2975648 RepID=UPI0022593A41|nr:hypothetical protein [Streptomyces sp. NBC_00091]MCX5380454.1 hypothetical protein [Streptomyces sp. NBC_00091]
MTNTFDDVRRHLKTGDIPAAVRSLRPLADTAPLGDLTAEVRPLAEAVGFDDLARAAKKASRKPGDAQLLYDFGYLCIERGIAFLAVPALREALRQAPGARRVLSELVAALEADDRHAEAAAVLLQHEALLEPWPGGYLLAYNSLLAGDLATARDRAARLPEPADSTWSWANDRLRAMLARAEAATRAVPLDRTDLRGWQFALTGTLLGTLSPYGFPVMTGRYAYLGDSHAACRRGLGRLALALDAAGRRPTAVSALPGRSDRILALAAAELLGLPLEPYAPGRPDTLVVAYDLSAHDPELLTGLRERAPGQVLYEHANRWTEPAAVPADFSALQRQVGSEPWGEQLGADGRGPADDRPEADIARDIVTADPAADPGDGEGPADEDAAFQRFVAAVAPLWLGGSRAAVGSPGPVPSSRF